METHNLFHHIDELTPKDRVLICPVVSTRKQEPNLNDQWRKMSPLVKERGAKTVGVKWYIGKRDDPKWIIAAVRKAHRLGATVLLFETGNRIVRNPKFKVNDRKTMNLPPTEKQLRQLAKRTKGLKLMTVVPPDAAPTKERSYHRKRGQEMKGKKGGRPTTVKRGNYKKASPEVRAKAKRLWEKGWSWRKIEDRLGFPQSTIRGWAASENWVCENG